MRLTIWLRLVSWDATSCSHHVENHMSLISCFVCFPTPTTVHDAVIIIIIRNNNNIPFLMEVISANSCRVNEDEVLKLLRQVTARVLVWLWLDDNTAAAPRTIFPARVHLNSAAGCLVFGRWRELKQGWSDFLEVSEYNHNFCWRDHKSSPGFIEKKTKKKLPIYIFLKSHNLNKERW